jgi:Ca-activated chloride channel homolog
MIPRGKMRQFRMMAIRLGVILLAISAPPLVAAQQEFQLKMDVSLVSLDVGVFDRQGEAVTTLGQEDFVILEDGERQEIRAFEPSGVAFNALLVVDRSGSMRRVWDSVVLGLNRFMGVLRLQDRVAIAAFDSQIEMETTWRSALGGKPVKIGIAPDGVGTDFYGAVIWAAGYIRGEKGRKGVIVFSDGQQSGSVDGTFKRALERARQVNVPFYFVGYGANAKNVSEMKQLAEASGGRAFFPSEPGDLVHVYEQIGRDLGRAYTISYAPSRSPDGKFRKIDVQTLDVRLHVSQSRDGYYAR